MQVAVREMRQDMEEGSIMKPLALIIMALWLLALICGAKYLQCRAEHLETGEWIMDDHRLYQVVDGRKVDRLDVDLRPILE